MRSGNEEMREKCSVTSEKQKEYFLHAFSPLFYFIFIRCFSSFVHPRMRNGTRNYERDESLLVILNWKIFLNFKDFEF